MPRGRAADTLPAELAVEVRGAVAYAREVKRLTNADLARHLKWDHRSVTSAMQSNQPLRAPRARALLDAAIDSGLRDSRGLEINDPELLRKLAWDLREGYMHDILSVWDAIDDYMGARTPALLMAESDAGWFSSWLADYIVEHAAGVSARKRDALRRTIRCALESRAKEFKNSAVVRLMIGFISALTATPQDANSWHKADAQFIDRAYELAQQALGGFGCDDDENRKT